jgi:hypothetical protein
MKLCYMDYNISLLMVILKIVSCLHQCTMFYKITVYEISTGKYNEMENNFFTITVLINVKQTIHRLKL